MASDDYDVPEPQDVFDHLMDIAYDHFAEVDDPTTQWNGETLHESVFGMSDEQLENAWEIESWEDLQHEAHDPDSGIKYH